MLSTLWALDGPYGSSAPMDLWDCWQFASPCNVLWSIQTAQLHLLHLQTYLFPVAGWLVIPNEAQKHRFSTPALLRNLNIKQSSCGAEIPWMNPSSPYHSLVSYQNLLLPLVQPLEPEKLRDQSPWSYCACCWLCAWDKPSPADDSSPPSCTVGLQMPWAWSTVAVRCV